MRVGLFSFAIKLNRLCTVEAKLVPQYEVKSASPLFEAIQEEETLASDFASVYLVVK